MSISKKFTVALVAILVSGIFVSALSIYFIERDHIASRAIGESERISRDSLRLLGVIDSIMAERVKSSMAALRQLGGNIGQPRQGERVRVNDREVPNLYFGDSPIANDVVLVDKLTSMMGGTATIFSKDGADFVRIATNVMTPTGRATGTVLAPQQLSSKSNKTGRFTDWWIFWVIPI